MDFSLSPQDWTVIGLSLKVSLVAVAVMLPIAFALAWILARWRFPGKLLLDALVHLPLVVPPVVTGWLLLLLFGHRGFFGPLLDQVRDLKVRLIADSVYEILGNLGYAAFAPDAS